MGRGGPAVPGPHRRLGRHLHRARPSGDRARAGGAGRAHHPEPGLRADLLPGAGAAARAARRDPAGRAHPRLLHQQRGRGQRRGRQAGAQGHRPHRGHRHRGQLPRAHDQHGLGHRPGQAPGQVPAADAGLPLRTLRPGGRGRGRARRGRGGADRRAGAGRGRRAHPLAGLPARALAAVPRQRQPAGRRRGADRVLPHRAAVRDRGRRRGGGLPHHGQGHRRRLPARRLRDDGRRRRAARGGRPRRHLLRQPPRLRRGGGGHPAPHRRGRAGTRRGAGRRGARAHELLARALPQRPSPAPAAPACCSSSSSPERRRPPPSPPSACGGERSCGRPRATGSACSRR